MADDAPHRLEDLPATVPIFPLQGVLLLPRAPLPLHIFEARYRALVRDALAGDQMIAMVQPSGEASDDPMNPPVFQTACLGRIVASRDAHCLRLGHSSAFIASLDDAGERP